MVRIVASTMALMMAILGAATSASAQVSGAGKLSLPSVVKRVVVAGNGRYLLMPTEAQTLLLVDTTARRIVTTLPFDPNKLDVAGGATKFVTFDRATHEFVRYDLATGAKEAERKWVEESGLQTCSMGLNSEGPIFVCNHDSSRWTYLFDLTTLTPLTLRGQPRNSTGIYLCRPAADGGFLIVSDGTSAERLDYRAGTIQWKYLPQKGHASFDGYRYFHPKGIDFADFNRTIYKQALPIMLRINGGIGTAACYAVEPSEEGVKIVFYVPGEPDPVAETMVPNVALGGFFPYEHVVYLAASKMILVVDAKNSELVFVPFDLNKTLRESPRNWFFVDSTVPSSYQAAAPWRYQIEVVARADAVLSYRLEAAPAGMTISQTGLIQWTPSDAQLPAEVAVSITDSAGRELIHRFTVHPPLNLQPTAPAVASTARATVGQPTPRRTTTSNTTTSKTSTTQPGPKPRPELAAALSVDCAKDKQEIRLTEPAARLLVAAGGSRLLAHLKQAGKVAVIDVGRAEIIKEVKLPAGAEPMAADRTSFAVYDGGQKKVSIWDLESGLELRSIPWTDGEVVQLTMGCDATGPLGVTRNLNKQDYTDFYDVRTLRPLQGSENRLLGREMGRTSLVSADGLSYLKSEISAHDHAIFHLSLDGLAPYNPHPPRRYVPESQDVWDALQQTWKLAKDIGEVERRPDATLNLLTIWKNRIADDRTADPTNGLVEVYGFDEPTLLFTLAGVELPEYPKRPNSYQQPNYNFQRFIPLLASSALVTVPNEPDRLVIHRVPLEQTLAALKRPRTFVVASAPEVMRAGEKWTHRLKAISPAGGVRYRIEQGPAGMHVDADGTLRWTPTEDRAATPVDVVVSITDGAGAELFGRGTGHELFHRMLLSPYPALGEQKPAASATVGSNRGSAATGHVVNGNDLLAKPPAKAAGPAREMTEIALPGKLASVAVGAGGRYLIAHIAAQDKVVAIDVVNRKIAYEIAVDHDEEVQLAAGAEKFFVAGKIKHMITRYDLKTGAKEKTITTPGNRIGAIAIGCSSDGPLLVSTLRGRVGTRTDLFNNYDFDIDFYDVAALAPKTMSFEPKADKTNLGFWWSSADGTVFTHVTGPVLTLYGTTVRRSKGDDMYYRKPSADGRILFCDAVMFNRDESPLDRPPGMSASNFNGRFFPSTTGPYFVNFHYKSPGFAASGSGRYMIHPQGEYQPLIALDGIEEFRMTEDDMRNEKVLGEAVIGYVPEADAFVAFRPSREAICIYRVKLDEELAKTDVDYLFVDSAPPKSVAPGKKFEYRVVGKTKRGKPTYQLTTAPKDMTLSPDGLLTWDAPPATAGSTQEVVINLKNEAGQEYVHKFRFSVGVPAPKPKTPQNDGRF